MSICEKAMSQNVKKCKKCNKPLVAIGHARENGKNHPEWDRRQLHKKCWKEEQEDERFRYFQALKEKEENEAKQQEGEQNERCTSCGKEAHVHYYNRGNWIQYCYECDAYENPV